MKLCDKTLADIIEEVQIDYRLSVSGTYIPIVYFVLSQLFKEVLECVDYLHKQIPSSIHRDLKPANILLKKETNRRFIKIGDFGLITFHVFVEQLHSSDAGQPRFMAPEVIYSKKYDTKADIYSLGAILE
jgi:serine/threonine protein kinase